jgi:hypothetical protein
MDLLDWLRNEQIVQAADVGLVDVFPQTGSLNRHQRPIPISRLDALAALGMLPPPSPLTRPFRSDDVALRGLAAKGLPRPQRMWRICFRPRSPSSR